MFERQPSLVSVITPAHNASKVIGETIKSVQNQTYVFWEMIIIDDCSDDNTSQIVEEFVLRDQRIKLFANEKNEGVAVSRNIGLSKAKGKYIAFLDSDDIWVSDKLEKQIVFMESNDLALSYSYYWHFSGNVQEPTKLIKCRKKTTHKSILKSNGLGCLTVVVNKEKTGEFAMPLLDHGEDMLTWYQLMKKGFVARCLPEPLAYYRIGAKSLSSNKKAAAKKQWAIYRSYLHFSLLKSMYYFLFYAFHGILKHFSL